MTPADSQDLTLERLNRNAKALGLELVILGINEPNKSERLQRYLSEYSLSSYFEELSQRGVADLDILAKLSKWEILTIAFVTGMRRNVMDMFFFTKLIEDYKRSVSEAFEEFRLRQIQKEADSRPSRPRKQAHPRKLPINRCFEW